MIGHVHPQKFHVSPSTRREWIEIGTDSCKNSVRASPSTRREWIEMSSAPSVVTLVESPSTRREWIEMSYVWRSEDVFPVSLHTEGVD